MASAPDSYVIKFFGAIEIEHNGAALSRFRSQKALALLAYLVSEGRPVTRDYLAGLAWPETEQKQALGLLRRTLHNLNQQLPGCLAIDKRTVLFQPDAPAEIDLREFVRLAALPDVADWTAAVDLYRAPFLEGVYLDDCPVLEQWLIVEQQRWQDQVVDLLARLIQVLSEEGDYAAALVYANRHLTLTPWQEEAHRQVMRLRLYNGQRTEALAQYARCVAILADELGVEPDAQTQALYDQIRTAPSYPPHNLPPQTTPLLGRQQELADLTRLLANPSQRLITLTGAGGMGKTRLALAAAERQLGQPTAGAVLNSPAAVCFTHGVFLVSLAAVTSAESMVQAITAALGLRLDVDGAERTPVSQLLDYLRAKRLLLVLDNFEQLLQEVEAAPSTGLLLEILRNAPEVQLLITSRERLRLAAEQHFPVLGLAYPDSESDLPMHVYPAVALFVQAAQRHLPEFRCDRDSAAVVTQICRTVAGMPLAIELAAASISILTPTEILAELTHSVDVLTTRTRHIPSRHRSMRAAIEVSWQQLNQAGQICFAQLSIFRNGFTRAAAASVADASLALLTDLVDKSWLRYRPEAQRYEVHELLRQFGAEMLAQSAGLQRQTRRAFCAHFAGKLAQWGSELKGADQQAICETMVIDGENIHQAWLWMVEDRHFDLLAQAVDGLGLFYQRQGRYPEGAHCCHVAVQSARTTATRSAEERLFIVKALTWQGLFEESLGRTQDAIALFEEAAQRVEADQTAPSPAGQGASAFLWTAFADSLLHIDRDRARSYLERSIAAYEILDEPWGLAFAYYGLSTLVREMGDYPASRAFAEQSLVLREMIGDQRGIADSLGWLGLIVMDMGELDEAERLAQRKLTVHRQLNDRPRIASGLDNLGLVDLFLGRNEAAEEKFEECLAIHAELGVQRRDGLADLWLGIALCMQGRYHEALKQARAGLAVAQGAKNAYATGHGQMLIGYLTLALGDSKAARQHIRAAIDGFEELGQRDELSQAWAWQSYVELADGRLAAAQQCLVRSLQINLEVRTILPLLEALPAAASLLCRQEEPALAIESYALAMTSPMLANSILIEDLAGKTIQAAEALLPRPIVAAAVARGRQRDLWETAAALQAHFAGE